MSWTECPTSFFVRVGKDLHANSDLIREIIALKTNTSLEHLPFFLSDAIIKYQDAYEAIQAEKAEAEKRRN